MQIFVPVAVLEELGLIPLATLISFYGYVLYTASNWLSKGSSMLLALYGPGLIGGFLIPILGAVPDSVMILISGIGAGSAAEVREQLAIGVGTLAGSTIMLITIPWAIGVYLGRRDIDESGRATTEHVDGAVVARYSQFTWTKTGVTVFPEIPFLAKSMMITAQLYLIIQIPALYYRSDPEAGQKEHVFALIGLTSSVIAFLIYSTVQLRSTQGQEIVKQMQKTWQRQQWRDLLIEKFPPGKSMKIIFRNFDLNGDDFIDRSELQKCLHSLGLNADDSEVAAILVEMDTGDDDGHGAGDERISYQEFERFFSRAIGLTCPHLHHSNSACDSAAAADGQAPPMAAGLDIRLMLDYPENTEWDDDCDELEDDGDTEITDDKIRREAFRILALGAVVVTVFSFPMVNTIEVFASKAGVKAFYISFVVTPIASNASEIIAALQFASKRNAKGVSLMFSTLYGAANMNNTFTLSVFLGIVAVRGLIWSFTAECLAILLVTLIVGVQGLKKTVHMWQAALVLALYPISIVLVWILNSTGL